MLDNDFLRAEIFGYCTCAGDEDDLYEYHEDQVLPEYAPVWQAFKECEFDMDRFMAEKKYELIDDDVILWEVMWVVCFPLIPLFERFVADHLNGYLNFMKRDPQLRWEDGSLITDGDVFKCLYDCKTEEDIWKLMAQGIGDVTALYHWYMGECPNPEFWEWTGIPCYYEKDEAQAQRFLQYLQEHSTFESVCEEVGRLKSKEQK